MIFRKSGKCKECGVPTVEQRDIVVTLDMFDTSPGAYMKGEIRKEVLRFKREPLYCDTHRITMVVT